MTPQDFSPAACAEKGFPFGRVVFKEWKGSLYIVFTHGDFGEAD